MRRIKSGYGIIILMLIGFMSTSVMAASSAYLTKMVITGEGWNFNTTLMIDVKDDTLAAENQIVNITIENAKFDESHYIGINEEKQQYKIVNNQTLQVILPARVPQGKIYIPIYGIMGKGEAILKIDGSQTRGISDATLIAARSVDPRGAVTTQTPTNINGKGEMASITIQEPFGGVLQGEYIYVTLGNENYKFINAGQIIVSRGFQGVVGVVAQVMPQDEQTIKILVPANINNSASGKLELKNVEISSLIQEPITEDIQVRVYGKRIIETTLTVAKVEGVQVTPDPQEKTKQFLNRLYETCLGRVADADGVNFWLAELQKGNATGASLADFFVNSTEFKNKGLSDKAYIETMYQVFFDRSADAEGLTYWQTELNQGLSRDYVLVGFVNSKEYQGICDNYEINRGNLTFTNIIDQYPNMTKFIHRLYLKCMNRTADAAGLEYWVKGITNQSFTGKSVAQYFTSSEEFRNSNLSDEAFVEILYGVFFDRVADEAGKSYWLDKIGNGESRSVILECFIESAEYMQICKDYGIIYQ